MIWLCIGCFMTTIRCDCCKGRRTLIGMGGIIQDCSHCLGVGHVKIKKNDSQVDAPVDASNSSVRVRGGRRKHKVAAQ